MSRGHPTSVPSSNCQLFSVNFGEGASVIATEDVEIVTLDNFLQLNQAKRIFLKLDTQGYDPRGPGRRERKYYAHCRPADRVILDAALPGDMGYPRKLLAYIQERGFAVCARCGRSITGIMI